MDTIPDDLPFVVTRPWIATMQREALRGDAYGNMLAGHCRLLGLGGMLDLSRAREEGGDDANLPCWEPYVEILNARLLQVDDAWTQAVRDRLEYCFDGDYDMTTLLVDPVTRAWIEARGMSMATMALMCDFMESVTLYPRGSIKTYETIGVAAQEIETDGDPIPVLDLGFSLAGTEHYWSAGTVSIFDAVSDTIQAAAAGRRLRDVYSHPALDGYDFVITCWDRDGIHTDISILKPVFPRAEPLRLAA